MVGIKRLRLRRPSVGPIMKMPNAAQTDVLAVNHRSRRSRNDGFGKIPRWNAGDRDVPAFAVGARTLRAA